MCGRFTLRAPAHQIVEEFLIGRPIQLNLRFNIAPTEEVLVVIPDAAGEGRDARMMRWGLVPHWAEDAKGAARMINARSESAAAKSAFRSAFRRRRCLIPADGYYEWVAEGKRKQPYHIRRADSGLLAFAGLWETWFDPANEQAAPLRTCTILTTEANSATRAVHDRMPAILEPHQYDTWLLSDARVELDALRSLLKPLHDDYPLVVQPANPVVNRAGNEGPQCLKPENGALDLFPNES